MVYSFRKRQGANSDDNEKNKRRKVESDDNESDDSEYNPENETPSDDGSSDDSSSEKDSEEESSENESINSDLIDINDNCDDENVTSHNLDLLNEDSLKRKLTKSLLLQIQNDLSNVRRVNINSYLNELEQKINNSDFSKNEEHKNNIISLSAVELSNSILRNLISEIRFEYKYNNDLDLKKLIKPPSPHSTPVALVLVCLYSPNTSAIEMLQLFTLS